VVFILLNETGIPVGIPYDRIIWNDFSSPLGTAARFNGFILGDATDLIDAEGAFAVSGNFSSDRVFSAAFGREGVKNDIPLSPYDVRYIAGGSTNVAGPLNVYGHVVSGSDSFNVAPGSSYFIGKSGAMDQIEVLNALYASDSGLPGWSVSDENGYYLVSSYDTPRFIPASRIGADLTKFFSDAKTSLTAASAALSESAQNKAFPSSGNILTGNDPDLNIFDLNYASVPEITDSIRLSVPAGSTALINIRTGKNVTISAPVIGTSGYENTTLINFPDAESIKVTYPSVFYGSLLAPKAAFYANTTGGHINGTAVLKSIAVQKGSGFELHWYPFIGNIAKPELPEIPEAPSCPVCPICPECPPEKECPSCPVCPECPVYPECPPSPEHPPMHECPGRPEAPPHPVCPLCPEHPSVQECPVFSEISSRPISPCHTPALENPPMHRGLIEGCVCICCNSYFSPKSLVRLVDMSTDEIIWQESFRGTKHFLFELDPKHSYSLSVISPRNCRPHVHITKAGVEHLCIEYFY